MRFDSNAFFAHYRQAFGMLGPYQFSGLTSMLDAAEADASFTSVRQLAYAFTTVQRATNVGGGGGGQHAALLTDYGPEQLHQVRPPAQYRFSERPRPCAQARSRVGYSLGRNARRGLH